ncbi:MAG: hypothetical protein J6Y78_11365 [Paludibacteraceae bacterium]|nr:hypothetical protein [Paludibacteraceae bacterium]
MSYSSPSDDLDKCEIYDYLSMELPLTEIIRKAWKDGFMWGKELGYEEAVDKMD